MQEALQLVKQRWLFLVSGASLFGVSALVWSISTQPIYQVSTVVQVVRSTDSEALSALSGQLGGLAALAGVSLPGGAEQNAVVAVLRSNALSEAFIQQHDLI